jgi:hypothetical protein
MYNKPMLGLEQAQKAMSAMLAKANEAPREKPGESP